MTECNCGEQKPFPARVRAQVNGFGRIITFMAGFECERPRDSSDSHGKHGADMLWLLIGPKATIQFLIYTGWLPSFGDGPCSYSMVLPGDLGYHARTPQYQGQLRRDCQWVEGGVCYYDGSGLQARDAFKVLVSQGEEALWSLMEQYYERNFGGVS